MAINKTSLSGKKTRIKGVRIIDPPPGIRPLRGGGEPPEAFVNSMRGMGDNIFQRPYVATLCGLYDRVFIDTPWPHLYADMPSNLILVSPQTNLRTQAKNINVNSHMYVKDVPSPKAICYRPRYRLGESRSIYREFDNRFPRLGFFFHMDPPELWANDLPFDPSEPFCLVRNTTTRREWFVPNRNCRNEYLQYAALRYKKLTGHNIIEIADIDGNVETLDGEHIQAADIRLVKGELKHPGLIWAFKNAAAVISCTGFALPLAQMVKANALIIFGGFDLPQWFTHKDHDCPQVLTLAPDKPCGCHKKGHNCSLLISPKRLLSQVDSLVRNQKHS